MRIDDSKIMDDRKINACFIRIKMGICYSQQQQWEAYNKSMREKRLKRKRQKNSSIIYEEKSIYESSFASNVENSFRQDIHQTINQIASEQGSISFGSVVDMTEEELQILYKSLEKMSVDGQLHQINDPITCCNLKTKNFLHTHRIKTSDCKFFNQVSCCPYNSNHIIEYDVWKLIKCDDEIPEKDELQQDNEQGQIVSKDLFFIYHPFTQRFLNIAKDGKTVVCSEDKMMWKIQSFGKRRNGGFLKIYCGQGELCMAEDKGLLQNHRKIEICKEKHVSHIWELNVAEVEEQNE